MNNHVELRKIRDFGEVFNAVFTFVRQEYKLLGKAILYFPIPIVLVGSILFSFAQSTVYSKLGTNPSGGALGMYSYMLTPMYLIGLMFTVIGSIVSIVTVYGYLSLYLERGAGNFTISDIWEQIKEHLGRTAGASFLMFFLALIIMVLSIIFLAIPFIYLLVATSFFYPIYIIEKQPFGYSISRCFTLIKGRWWSTFGTYFLVYMIIYFASLIFLIPTFIMGMVTGAMAVSGDSSPVVTVLFIFFSVLGTVGTNILYPIFYITIGVQYFNMVEEKENTALLQEIKNINLQDNFSNSESGNKQNF